MRIAKNISFPNPRGPVAATDTQLLEQGHEVRCLICTLHFLSPLKCSSMLHFLSLQRKNSNVSCLIPLNGHCGAPKKRIFWKLIIKKKQTWNCLCAVFFLFSSLRNNSSNNTLPNISGRRTAMFTYSRLIPGKTSLLLFCLFPAELRPTVLPGLFLQSST